MAETKKRGRLPEIVIVLAIIIIILLLLLRGCRPPEAGKFDYFRAKAGELGNDPARMLSFVKELPTLNYTGDVKGALATLWNGAGSAAEKKALAEALLATGKGRTVSLDEVAAGAKEAGPVCKLAIVHRTIAADGTAKETPIVEAPIGAFVGDVHSVSVPAEGKTHFEIRAHAATTKDVSVEGATAEEVVFSFQRPGDEQPIKVVRELWHKENRVGATHAKAGDRHDFVVLPTRTTKYVREKEELILKEANRKDAPEAKPYLTLLDYARRSDVALASLEKKSNVRAQFETPRILVLSKFVAPELPGGSAMALDLRWNRTMFEGDPIMAYQAQQVRSFVESGLEQNFLVEKTGLASTSTFDVFSRMKDDLAATPRKRLDAIRRSLDEVSEHGGSDASVTFSARDPHGKKRDHPVEATVSRDATGFHVKSGPVDAAFAKKLAEAPDAPKIAFGASGLDASFESGDDAAVAVETALLGAAVKPPVDPTYVLDTKLDRGHETLVCEGAVFELRWGEGETRTEQRIKVTSSGEGLEFKWRVQSSALPAAGTRKILPEALAKATVHNPWYRLGKSEQKEATSFCVSRQVHDALASGKTTPFALEAKLGPDEDPKADRKIEWKGELQPLGKGSVTVPVNGKPTKLDTLRLKLDQTETAILDERFPVGMADKIVKIATAIRGKLVDERGLGIADARVTIADSKILAVATAIDGSFRLPPAPGGGYGKVKLRVTIGSQDPVDLDADLTAPGLDEVVVKTPRPRPELLWVTNADALEPLPLSAQVKRNARRDLEAGRTVVIPSRMVKDADGEAIGYFSCDRETGYLVGVTEDGLNGSNAWNRALESAMKSVESARNADAQQGASAAFHMYRGAVVSMWTYCSFRLEGMSNKQAVIATLEQMDMWAENLQLTHFANQALDDMATNALGTKAADKLAGQLTSLVNGGIVKTDDDAAKAAFKIGYMGAVLFLGKMCEDDDDDQ